MSVEVEGKRQQWTERRLVVRSVRHAEAAEAALRARVAKAKAQVEALNLRGRGRKRFEEIKTVTPGGHRDCPASPRRGLFVAALRPAHHDAARSERIRIGPRM